MSREQSARVILHVYADTGVESEVLSAYGRVIRFGLDPLDTNDSEPIQADATQLPLQEDFTADLGVFHPPCQPWSPATSVSGNPDDHPNLIPDAREAAEKYCDHWIIENVPNAPLNDPVVLDGRMFGLPIANQRAFETSFHVEQPPRFAQSFENWMDSGSWAGSTEFWRTLKGYSGDYPSRELKRSGTPRPFVDYLLRHWLQATKDTAESELEVHARAD